MKQKKLVHALSMLALLSACGGGGGGGGNTPPTSGAPSPNPPVASNGCSVRERQDWAGAQINEWYLFPETLPTNPSPAGYATVTAYIDYLTATARAQGRDRFFTYLTSIAEENAYYTSGSTAGFGFRLSFDSTQQRLFVAEAFEGAPALAAGIDRGTEILAIGTSADTLRTIAAIVSAEGEGGINNAIGPSTAGTVRVLRISNAAGIRDVTVTKMDYELLPVSTRYGSRIIDDGGRRVGYLNLRTFISSADPALRQAFANFRAEGITEIIIDLRYNGGGLVSIAELMGDLLGGNRTSTDVLSYTTFRPSKAAENETRFFRPQPQSVSPVRIAFIGTGGTASASELVINAFIPYLGANAALVGTNTYGKPVGQIALDRTQCDDRLRIVAFATQNRDRQGDYFSGLADTVQASCRAGDDLAFPLGDPRESSVARALDFLAQRPCSSISGGVSGAAVVDRELLTPERPSTAQREVPGLF
ncbi:MAG TPA: S41 family peptidase [Allosphingosinicella sp.]|nr:S41 family peptidase [Allosphingosinicella sp.]